MSEQMSFFDWPPVRGRITTTRQERKTNGQFKVAGSNPGWNTDMIDLLPRFLSKVKSQSGGATFVMEQFRAFAKASRFPEPTHVNAWGALTTTAVKAGLIRPTDRYVPAKNPSSHARIVRVWEAT